MDIVRIIKENSLTVRCLPEVVTYKHAYSKDYKLKDNEKIEYWKPGLKYFSENNKYSNPQKMMDNFYTTWGKKGRPFVVGSRQVDKGGWWYVKEVGNISSMVRFDREYDKFFAPTLKEAIELYLDSKV